MQGTAQPSAAIDATRWVAVGSLLLLIAVCLAWEMWLAPIRPGGSPIIAAMKALPLCVPLAGLLRRRMYTYRWLSLFLWLYFAEGVTRAWKADGVLLALCLAEVALSLILFAACAAHVRFRLKATHDHPA